MNGQRRVGRFVAVAETVFITFGAFDPLSLLESCADIYARRDDANRRLCNQAFFTELYLDEDNDLHAEFARPYEILLDPSVHADALT